MQRYPLTRATTRERNGGISREQASENYRISSRIDVRSDTPPVIETRRLLFLPDISRERAQTRNEFHRAGTNDALWRNPGIRLARE